jgi:hypothetical protein
VAAIEEVRIDVRDVDYEWFRDVQVFLDRDTDIYHFPRKSAERLGEIDEETGDFHLIDGQVEATAGEVEVDGVCVSVGSAGCDQLVVRPSVKSPAWPVSSSGYCWRIPIRLPAARTVRSASLRGGHPRTSPRAGTR